MVRKAHEPSTFSEVVVKKIVRIMAENYRADVLAHD